MHHPFKVETRRLDLPDQHLVYRLYRNPDIAGGRRLVLLHGAGVAGVDTWHALIASLDQWSEILVPDQRGMGDTRSPDAAEHPFDIAELVADFAALLNHLGWRQFDLGGYSLGGLVAMRFKEQQPERVGKQFLLESAVLDRPDWLGTVEQRQRYSHAAEHLRGEDAERGIYQFLDAISPGRNIKPESERLMVARLAQRAQGFANALDAVTRAIDGLDREALVAAQGDVSSFIGGRSVEPMHQYHRALAERLPNWHYFLVAGTDHSLPFQKPRQIGRIMNAELQRYLDAAGS
ncbi:putative 2-succinyl-6-hydroxy-2,4-cyclohexadiene-1-carboxylate synthase [Marinobacterium nitratireducens]|uniref:2-succinyl-6-hydroxy-2,4-cyclohexadiene-1-carboxylate synthase n=1 Tax=Marinobacterium nitratireducens TaxID=518897 RepID=A0A917ZLU6_9GAMM|nr:alpha/beta hydrolase [Marinobacterium nitratireducens]GGO85465.1 putative 2-succinyl-6-hydroxy-2,4-cyclohexadiene-1-carboxylate synthase [Marinobacterium nitratireducens]